MFSNGSLKKRGIMFDEGEEGGGRTVAVWPELSTTENSLVPFTRSYHVI